MALLQTLIVLLLVGSVGYRFVESWRPLNCIFLVLSKRSSHLCSCVNLVSTGPPFTVGCEVTP